MKDETKRSIKIMGTILFILYILALVYFLFFAESYGRADTVEHGYRYNLTPFKEIRRFWIYRDKLGIFAVFANICGNVIGFIPFGMILPLINRNTRGVFFIGVSGFTISLCVEVIQLICKVGCFDVDDLILNTLGAVIGYMIFAVCHGVEKLVRKQKRR